jgi:adenylylsulfate kinase
MDAPKSENITWHDQLVTRSDLEQLHGHKGSTIWFTGLSASGKSTLANAASIELHKLGISTFVLDGDNVRHWLNKDLGFSHQDRVENIRRIGEVARLFTAAALVNLTAFISPFRSDRQIARTLQPETFIEVHCAADLAVCESRDPKGIYKKARAGEIKGFTGIDSPYEAPLKPELSLDTGTLSVEACVAEVLALLRERKIIPI